MSKKNNYTKKSDKNTGCFSIIAILIVIVMFRSCIGCDSDEQEKTVSTSVNVSPLYNNSIETDTANKKSTTENTKTKASPTQNKNRNINQSTSNYQETKQTKGAKPTSAKRSSGREYIRGKRGGCYYINSNGNKTYVDRNLCD